MVDTHILKTDCKIQDFYKIDKVLGEFHNLIFKIFKIKINNKTKRYIWTSEARC